MTPAVLVTRSRPGAEETAARLAGMGLTPVLTPMLEVAPLAFDAERARGAQAIVLTSRHAADRLADVVERVRILPRVFTVGGATAAAARAAGASDVVSADGDARALIELVARRLDPTAGPLALLRGAQVAANVAGALTVKGFAVTELVVYQARARDRLAPEAAGALRAGSAAAVLFHSARGARAFAEAVRAEGLEAALDGVIAASLSEAAGAPVAGLGFQSRVTAVQPTENALLEALANALKGRC